MAKNANGDGSITKLASGKYRYRVVIGRDTNQKLIRKSFTSTSPQACKKMYKEWLKAYNPEKPPIEKSETVADWGRHWLEVYKKDKVEWITYNDYKMYLENHIIPSIGKLKLVDVKPAYIEKLYTDKMRAEPVSEQNPKGRKGLSNSALQKIKIILNGIFEPAIDNGLCQNNPARKPNPLKREQNEMVVFTPDEMRQIVEFIPHHEYGSYIAILIYSGLRIGELLALMWSDIDMNNNTITVRRGIKHTEDGTEVGKDTKGKKVRLIPFDEALIDHFKKLPRTSLFVVPYSDGGHHTHSSFDTIYNKFFADLNENRNPPVPVLSPHKCRHTFATYMMRNGVDAITLQKLLGHAQLSTTAIYTHIDVDDLKRSVKKLKY